MRRLAAPGIVAPALVLLVVLALWQLGAFHGLFGLRTFSVPYPDAIVAGLGKHGQGKPRKENQRKKQRFHGNTARRRGLFVPVFHQYCTVGAFRSSYHE